jgi:riboflavin kinase/FMN adenylyltransferase
VNVLRSIASLSTLPGPVFLAVGVFDGVHLGHRAVIDQAIRGAKTAGGTAVALTFDPHPAAILRPERAPALLTSTRHKLRLLRQIGVQQALVVEFTSRFASTPPEEFISELVSAARPLRQVCVGENWAFGKGRSGNLDLLQTLGGKLGFEAVGLPAVTVNGASVSSTAIRTAVESGDLSLAARLLGRDFSVFGKVAVGRKLGRTIGVPTANLLPESEQLPPNGVYAVNVATGNEVRPGVANIGVRPTVSPSGTERILEVHLFDFSGDLYGCDLEISFLRFLRAEHKFPNLEALRTQIAADVSYARSILLV